MSGQYRDGGSVRLAEMRSERACAAGSRVGAKHTGASVCRDACSRWNSGAVHRTAEVVCGAGVVTWSYNPLG